MTVDEFRALPPDQRRAAWQALPEAERRQLSMDLLAVTPGVGLPYPDNYSDPADSPSALQALAEAVEAVLQAGSAEIVASYVKGPTAQVTTNWDTAVQSGFWTSPLGAANRPSSGNDNSWLGLVSRLDGGHIVQVVWPVGGGPVPRDAIHHRTCSSGTWGGWARLSNWSHSWGTLDNFITHMHGSGDGVPRFATGMKKDAATAAPTNLDAWRVQCYDTSGGYLWTAIQVPESGVVSFPKGHSLLVERIAAGEPVAADTVLTVGALQAILGRVLGEAADMSTLRVTEPQEAP